MHTYAVRVTQPNTQLSTYGFFNPPTNSPAANYCTSAFFKIGAAPLRLSHTNVSNSTYLACTRRTVLMYV